MSLRSRNARQHFRRATFIQKVLQEKCRGPVRLSPNADTHFVRACAVEMRMSTFHKRTCFFFLILQEKCRGPEPRTTLCSSLRNRNALQHFTTATFYGNLQEKLGHRSQDHTLCKPAQSKCTSTFRKIHFLRKFTGKMPGPRVSKHPDEAPAFTLSVGTSQCGHTVWGKTVLITGLVS